MIGEKMDTQGILSRLMAAYGVDSQKSLAESLDIPANNISGWVQRGSVPGNPIIKCALDTGSDLRWLVTGEFANANNTTQQKSKNFGCGKQLIEKMLATGGRAVLQRVIDAYGFKTQKELSEYLGISTGTISTWVRREYFPGDVVITCALDTGASLGWLATGTHEYNNFAEPITKDDTFKVSKFVLAAGKLEEEGTCTLDKTFVPGKLSYDSIYVLHASKKIYIVNSDVEDVSNGTWILNIDGVLDIYTISRRPHNRLKVISHMAEFECSLSDVNPVGFIVAMFDIVL
ncbi:phage repressor protein CI [Rahnella inusitata]|uniref:phage repressor protein CI n=1 Tax=Rahnella inusitata TaxID=58169 RepID=UPI0039BE6617